MTGIILGLIGGLVVGFIAGAITAMSMSKPLDGEEVKPDDFEDHGL